MPSPKDYPEEIWGIEDPRITFVPELQQYVVTYTSYSRGGPGVSLALTKDFRSFERYGVIMPPGRQGLRAFAPAESTDIGRSFTAR